MCPRLRHGPRLSVEPQSDLSWGWMSHAPLALCPCPPGGRHHLADPMHHVSCGVHGPAAFRLALPLDAPRGGPRCPVGHPRGLSVEWCAVICHISPMALYRLV